MNAKSIPDQKAACIVVLHPGYEARLRRIAQIISRLPIEGLREVDDFATYLCQKQAREAVANG